MSGKLYVFRDPPLDGPTNMARDEHFLHSPDLRPAVLRLYAWEPPTISLGYFQRYSQLEHLPPEVRRLAVVRRITGGGAILHDREVTYCLTIDDSIPIAKQPPVALYRLVHGCWRDTLQAEGVPTELAPPEFPLPTPRGGPFFCFQKPGCTDLILPATSEQGAGPEPVKLLGSAQRRIPGRVLQHGSLLLGRRYQCHPGADLGQPPPDVVERWIGGFLQRLASALELTPVPTSWTAEQLADVRQRRARYDSAEWTRAR